MQYYALFDLAATGYHAWPFVFIAAGVVVSNLIVWIFFPKIKGRCGMHVFSVVMVGVMVGLPYWDYAYLLKAYRNKEYRVVEGKVENYWYNERYSKHKKRTVRQEGFTVGGVKFAYNLGGGADFTNGATPRIPFRDGMVLRVSYVPEQQLDIDQIDNRIIKLEKAEEAVTTYPLPVTNY